MAFQYYGGGSQPQIDYGPAPQQQQQGMPGLQGLQGLQGFDSIFNSIAGNSAGSEAGGVAGSAIGGGGASAGSSAGAAAGEAIGGGGGSALASAGPWALLAAVIMANESEANKAGRRAEDRGERAQDMITGKVLEQDMDYYGDKVGGVGGELIKGVGQLGHPEGVFNLLKRGSLARKLFS